MAAKQPGAGIDFQPLDLMADSGRRQTQLRCRLFEAEMAGGGLKGAKGGERG